MEFIKINYDRMWNLGLKIGIIVYRGLNMIIPLGEKDMNMWLQRRGFKYENWA
jgi:hypothetical protein